MGSPIIGGTKIFKPKPPDKGSFPLDHEGECKISMGTFMRCMEENTYDNSKCRRQAKDYLDCRMQKELMAKEPWHKLGYADLEQATTEQARSPSGS